jgi:pyridoxamine 5'-phosphate oxidase-like protein
MPATKRASKKKQPSREAGPTAARPHMTGYGVPKDKKGLLPWSHVTDRMEKAMHYWISTVSPEGRPHATPVDGLWIDEQLYFGGMPDTRRHRNLLANPAVCVHLESAMDVIILRGDARELPGTERSLNVRLAEASVKKYGYGPPPDAYAAGGVWVLRPRVVLAWKQFPKDVTRWKLDSAD